MTSRNLLGVMVTKRVLAVVAFAGVALMAALVVTFTQWRKCSAEVCAFQRAHAKGIAEVGAVARQMDLKPFPGVSYLQGGKAVPSLAIGFPGNVHEKVEGDMRSSVSMRGIDQVGVVRILEGELPAGAAASPEKVARYVLVGLASQVEKEDARWRADAPQLCDGGGGAVQLVCEVGIMALTIFPIDGSGERFALQTSHGLFSRDLWAAD